jgi:Predicted acetyltransferase
MVISVSVELLVKMDLKIYIRQEEQCDFKLVEQLVDSAFKYAEHSDGNEASLVRNLRDSESFIPELSLVAIVDNVVAGHILFTRIGIGDGTGIALAPLSVLPSYQRKGIGSALIVYAHEKARRMGFAVSVVLGSPKYYMRHGYVPADSFGITSPFEVAEEYYMACQLCEHGQSAPQGVVLYDRAFGVEG